MTELSVGEKYHVVFRFKRARREHEIVAVYRGINESPVQGFDLHTFDIGGGATYYLGEGCIKEVEAL